MGRNFLWGAWTVLMVAVALGALIWRFSRPESSRRGAPLAPLPPAAEGAPAPPPPPTALPPGEPIAGAQNRTVGRRGKSKGKLFSGLGSLGESVAQCTARSTPASGSLRQAILVLELEPLAGRVKIVGASPYPGTNASDALVLCAQSEMVGREVALATARPGRTYKMSYSIRY